MYDLLMNLLEERGVSNAFVDKLSGLATKREHELYVKLLQKLQDFVKGEWKSLNMFNAEFLVL